MSAIYDSFVIPYKGKNYTLDFREGVLVHITNSAGRSVDMRGPLGKKVRAEFEDSSWNTLKRLAS